MDTGTSYVDGGGGGGGDDDSGVDITTTTKSIFYNHLEVLLESATANNNNNNNSDSHAGLLNVPPLLAADRTLLTTIHNNLNDSLANVTGAASASSISAEDAATKEFMRILQLCVLILLFVLILCGNTFVLVALHNRKLKMNRMYFFLTHLSIADMITGFFNVLSQAAWVWTITFRGDNVLCKFVKYTQMLGPYLSSYVLVMTSIDRYQAICHPLSHSSSTHSRSRYMILTAWLISLFFCLPQSIIFSYQKVDHPPYVDCWVTFAETWMAQLYVTWYAFSIFIIPFCIIAYTHVLICHEIWLNWHTKRQSLMNKHPHHPIHANGQQQQQQQQHHHGAQAQGGAVTIATQSAPCSHHNLTAIASRRHNSASETVLYYTQTSSLESGDSRTVGRLTAWWRACCCWWRRRRSDSSRGSPTSLLTAPSSAGRRHTHAHQTQLMTKCDHPSSSSSAALPPPHHQCPHHHQQHHHHHHQQHLLHQHLLEHHSHRPSLSSMLKGLNVHDNNSKMNEVTQRHEPTTTTMLGDVIEGTPKTQPRPTNTTTTCVCHRIAELYGRAHQQQQAPERTPQGVAVTANNRSGEGGGHHRGRDQDRARTPMVHAKSDSELCFDRQRKRTRRRLRREDNQMLKMCPINGTGLSGSTSASSSSSSLSSSSSCLASALSLADGGNIKQSGPKRKADQQHVTGMDIARRPPTRRYYSMSRLDRRQRHQTSVPLEQLFGWIREFRALISDAKNVKTKNVDDKTSSSRQQHQAVSTTTSYCSTTVECCYSLSRKNVTKPINFGDKDLEQQPTRLCNCGCCLCCDCCEYYDSPTLRSLGAANRALVLTKLGGSGHHDYERDIVDEEEDKIVRMASRYHPEGSARSSLVGSGGNIATGTGTNVIIARNTTPSTTSNYSVPTTPNGGKVLIPRSYRIVNPVPASSTDSPPLSTASTMVRGRGRENKDNPATTTTTTAAAAANNKRLSNPRIHSMHGLTRAKIKTVKITLVVITCYVLCSSPFILSQLWVQWWPDAQNSSFYSGPMMAVLMLMPSLNSCVNPWIYMFFNPNLVTSFFSMFKRKSSKSNLNPATNRNAHHRVEGQAAAGVGANHCPVRKTLTNESRPEASNVQMTPPGSKFDMTAAGGHGEMEPGTSRKDMFNLDQMSISTKAVLTKQHNRLLQVKQMSVGHSQSSLSQGENGSDLENSDHCCYNSSVTLNTTISGNAHPLHHHQQQQQHQTTTKVIGKQIGKTNVAKTKAKSTKRRRISIQFDRMWNKLTVGGGGESHQDNAKTDKATIISAAEDATHPKLTKQCSSTASHVQLYNSSSNSTCITQEQFVV